MLLEEISTHGDYGDEIKKSNWLINDDESDWECHRMTHEYFYYYSDGILQLCGEFSKKRKYPIISGRNRQRCQFFLLFGTTVRNLYGIGDVILNVNHNIF